MAYENPLMTELMVPRHPVVAARIVDFYELIDWDVRNSTGSEYFTYVNPQTSEGVPPTVAYWQTENTDKIARFEEHDDIRPSVFAQGLRLSNLQDLIEVCLVVPSDDNVHAIFERGGRLLERHTHILPRDHAGSQEFRFSDPFNYSLRVTANPGWEITPSDPSLELQLSDPVDVPPEQVVTKDDFRQLRGNLGFAGLSWNGMIRNIVEKGGDDCPLSLVKKDDQLIVVGDLEAGVEWFKEIKKGTGESPLFIGLLEELHQQRG